MILSRLIAMILLVREVSVRLLLLALLNGPRTDQHPPSLRPSNEENKKGPGRFPGPRPGKEPNQQQEYVSDKVSGDKLMSPSKEMTASTAQMRYILQSAEERRRI